MKKKKKDTVSPLNNNNNLSISDKLKISLGINKDKDNHQRLSSKSLPASPMNVINDMQSPLTNMIGEVAAIGVFVNRQMIMKIYPDDIMEGAFRATYEDFKKECINFFK